MKPTYLATKNHHPMDDRISFEEESHTYTIDGDSSFTSVTTFVHQHFPHFDSEKTIASLLSEKKNFKGRTIQNNNKYRKMAIANIQEILQQRNEDSSVEKATALLNDTSSPEYKQQTEFIDKQWKQTSVSGTKTHADIEYYYNELAVDNDTPEYAYFQKFQSDFREQYPDYAPYRTEWTVFYKELKLAGSIDMIFENTKDGTLMIYDWKRVKCIEYDAFDNITATSPHLKDMPNSNFWHYSLQLNTYKAIIESQYDKKVTKLVLVRLYPDAPSYELHECADLQKEVKELFRERYEIINTKK